MPDYLWKYFDPDGAAIFVDPILLVKPVIKPPPQALVSTSELTTWNTQPTKKTPEHQTDNKSRDKKNMDIYFKWYRIYRDVRKKWEYYHVVQTKL